MISILLERLRSTPASPMGMGVSYKYNNHNPLALASQSRLEFLTTVLLQLQLTANI